MLINVGGWAKNFKVRNSYNREYAPSEISTAIETFSETDVDILKYQIRESMKENVFK